MFDKISLIIPTHNRHQYLTRVLDYYNGINLKILVADSSQKEYPFKNKYDIDYFHYPNYIPLKKLADIIQKVKTPYVFICADDDFVIPGAVEKCIKFLDNNSDYSSAQGIYFKFRYGIKNIVFSTMYTSSLNLDLNENSVEKRLKTAMKNYIPMVYCVNRTENLKDSFNLPSLSDFSMDELTLWIVSLINGKHKVFPIPYGAREVIKNSSGSIYKSLCQRYKDQETIEIFNEFSDILSYYYSKKSDISTEKAKKIILKVIELKIRGEIKRIQKRSFILKLFYNVFINLLFLLHQKIRDIGLGFFKIILKIRFFHIILNNNSKLYFNFENPNSIYFDDFKRIKSYISFYSIYITSRKAKDK